MRITDLGTRAASASLLQIVRGMARGHAPTIEVQRRQIPYWEERGWTRRNRVYTGNYQTRYAAFCGQADEHRGGHIDFFLYSPSPQIRSHSHWVCFQPRANDWYMVHMATMPKDVSSGIITIERLITEAYQ